MTFAELAEIVGKPVRTVTQAFHRKGYSIKKPTDIQAYLHLTLRSKQIRKKQPLRSVEHLRMFHFQPAHREPRDVAAWVAAVRRIGRVDRLTPARQAVLARLATYALADSRACLGVIFAGDFFTGGAGLTVLSVYLPRPSRRLAAERFAFFVGQAGERDGFTPRVVDRSVDAVPGLLATDPDLAGLLRAGRVEYGWVSLPIG